MKSPVVKRSVMIADHRTSVSLEAAFWQALKDIAAEQRLTLGGLIEVIDTHRRQSNLSSAIRVFVLDHYCRLARSRAAERVRADARSAA